MIWKDPFTWLFTQPSVRSEKHGYMWFNVKTILQHGTFRSFLFDAIQDSTFHAAKHHVVSIAPYSNEFKVTCYSPHVLRILTSSQVMNCPINTRNAPACMTAASRRNTNSLLPYHACLGWLQLTSCFSLNELAYFGMHMKLHRDSIMRVLCCAKR